MKKIIITILWLMGLLIGTLAFASDPQQCLGTITYASGLESNIKKMPVLNQFLTNTCATFATTEAIDITHENGSDYFNIYTNLCLGYYLSQLHTLIPPFFNAMSDPWFGTDAFNILYQDQIYGMTIGEAPHDQDGAFYKNGIWDNSAMLAYSIKESKPADQNAHPSFNYSVLYDETVNSYPTISKSQAILNALNQGEVVVLSFTMDNNVNPVNGAQGGMSMNIYPDSNGNYYSSPTSSDNKAPDTFAVDQQILNDTKNNSNVNGHCVVVTGYLQSPDSPEGYFVIRNSWGAKME